MIELLAKISLLEAVSVLFGIVYIVLAMRENHWCWPAALVSTSTAMVLFWDASLPMESALNVYYLFMAVYGWQQWHSGGPDKTVLRITSWALSHHAWVLLLIAVLTLLTGTWLSANTEAALPYVDSFTTWSAVITTWMVARKILENWLYWVVIDTVSIWMYLQRELYLYGVLFLVYTVLAIAGYWQWRKNYTQQHAQ